MSAAAHHDAVTTLTYTDVVSLVPAEGGFDAIFVRRPKYVDEEECIGCRLCEYACPVDVPHAFEGELGARRAIYIPFGTAIPQKAVVDLESCILCGKCEKACPTDAIDFLQEPETIEVHARAAVVATGFRPTPVGAKREYGAGTASNVIGGPDMERLLSPNGPYGRVLRPSDGKIPDSIAYVQCAGSRDETLGVPYCSRVCCMYAIKQAMLLSGALPIADVTIYYMDIRAFGKGYEEFFQTARSMGIDFVKAKVARIVERPDGDLDLRVELQEEDGRVVDVRHDLVVLSVGMRPGDDVTRFAPVSVDAFGFVRSLDGSLDATRTDVPGLFAAGTAVAPKDIVDSVAEASAVAMQVSAFLRRSTAGRSDARELEVAHA
jgi:heterodisulfide reductase subunit A